MMVVSPLTCSTDVSLVHRLTVTTIIKRYHDELGMDVSRFFDGMDEVVIYQCNQSKLKFYYPFSLIGDAAFYTELASRYNGYYSPWKWEHEQVFQQVKFGDRVLEIGCGNGYFLQRLPEKGAAGLGLEMNEGAIEFGKQLGVDIRNERLETHAEQHAGQYDLVCAFQVFEHVNEVGDFFRQAAHCVKPGGLLAIGVPNNASYYFRKDLYHTLNLPPHHMVLWEPVAMKYAGILLMDVMGEILIEPATSIHRSVSYRLWLENVLGNHMVTALIYRATRFIVKYLPVFMSGATAVALYRKK